MAGESYIYGGFGGGGGGGAGGDLFKGIAGPAAAGSAFGPWGTAIGAGVGLVGGLASFFGKQAQSDAMRAQMEEQLRRQKLEDERRLGMATAAGMSSGIEGDSGSLQGYLAAMKAEMERQRAWTRSAGLTNAGNVGKAAGWGLLTDIGSTFNSYAKDNNYWRGG